MWAFPPPSTLPNGCTHKGEPQLLLTEHNTLPGALRGLEEYNPRLVGEAVWMVGLSPRVPVYCSLGCSPHLCVQLRLCLYEQCVCVCVCAFWARALTHFTLLHSPLYHSVSIHLSVAPCVQAQILRCV